MKLIPLTQGMFTMVDDEDFDFLMEFKWHARKAPRTWYARSNFGGQETGRTAMCMHQLLALGAENIDHWDRNGLNNCKSNLRISTLSQNHGNQAKTTSPSATSKYKGVCLERSTGLWMVHIGMGKRGVRKYLGRFRDEEEAGRAYDAAAIVRFGEFARLNFPNAIPAT